MQVLLLALVCFAVSVSVSSAEYYELTNATQYFEYFKIKYDKHYANEHEMAARFEVFKANLEHINRLNEENDHTVFAIKGFADLTSEEFKRMYTGNFTDMYTRRSYNDKICKLKTDDDIPFMYAPESFDWRSYNVVTRVKNQGYCQSCWAFSATGVLEAQAAIKHKLFLELSEQQLINCDVASHGCCKGYPSTAFKAVMKKGGIMREEDYVYEARQMACEVDPNKFVVRVTDCTSYYLQSQEKVKQLLYNVGPISIVIKSSYFQHHDGGIIMDESCNRGEVDHAVLLVGYGSENGIPYWTIKNSWGSNNNENGYLRIQRSDNMYGACGMLNIAMTTAEIA